MSTLDVTHMTNCTRLSPSLMGREPGNEVIDWLVQHYHTGCFGEPKLFVFTSVDFQQSTHGVAILVWERTAIQVQDNVNHSNNNSSMGINWSTISNSSTGYLTRQGDSQYIKTSGYHTNSMSLFNDIHSQHSGRVFHIAGAKKVYFCLWGLSSLIEVLVRHTHTIVIMYVKVGWSTSYQWKVLWCRQ